MTAALRLPTPDRFAPFLATTAPAARAWMLRPATVTAAGLAWTVATDGASLYAEPGAQGYPPLTDPPRALEEILQRATERAVTMLDEDRQLLRRFALTPLVERDGLRAVAWEGAHYDARRVLLALDALRDSPRLGLRVTRVVARSRWDDAASPFVEGREMLLIGSDGRCAVLMNC